MRKQTKTFGTRNAIHIRNFVKLPLEYSMGKSILPSVASNEYFSVDEKLPQLMLLSLGNGMFSVAVTMYFTPLAIVTIE